VQLGGTFDLEGRRVVLIHAPGFGDAAPNDTAPNDTEVLNAIAAFLETSYKGGLTLAGVLYFHRAAGIRTDEIAKRNLNMFRKLCGDAPLKNVTIVLNAWGEVDPQKDNLHKAKLESAEMLFKPIRDKHAKIVCYESAPSSAKAIADIRHVFDNNPLPLRIQKELVDEKKVISKTDAGKGLKDEIAASAEGRGGSVGGVGKMLGWAIGGNDEKSRRLREAEKAENEHNKRMESDYKIAKKKLESALGRGGGSSYKESRAVASWTTFWETPQPGVDHN